MDELYNQLDIDKDNYESEIIVDTYFKVSILLFKVGYVGETLGEDKIMDVLIWRSQERYSGWISEIYHKPCGGVIQEKGPFQCMLGKRSKGSQKIYQARILC